MYPRSGTFPSFLHQLASRSLLRTVRTDHAQDSPRQSKQWDVLRRRPAQRVLSEQQRSAERCRKAFASVLNVYWPMPLTNRSGRTSGSSTPSFRCSLWAPTDDSHRLGGNTIGFRLARSLDESGSHLSTEGMCSRASWKGSTIPSQDLCVDRGGSLCV